MRQSHVTKAFPYGPALVTPKSPPGTVSSSPEKRAGEMPTGDPSSKTWTGDSSRPAMEMGPESVKRKTGGSCRAAGGGTSNAGQLLPHLPDEIALLCLARVPDVGPLRAVCRRWNEAIDTSEEFLLARARAGLKPMEWLYVLVCGDDGSSYSWHAFDPANSEWRALPAMPEEVDFQLTSPGTIGMSYQVQCMSTGRKLVMLAGLKRATGPKKAHQWSPLEPALKSPWVFDPRRRGWTTGRPFATPRRWCVCGAVGSKVYVASGCGLVWNASLSRSTDVYDTEADAWESLPLSLQSSKFSGEAITAATVGGDLYVVSGTERVVKVGAVFRSATRTWWKMPESLKAGWIGSCVGVEDKFYVVDDLVGKLSVYDTAENRWIVVLEDARLKGLTGPTSVNGRVCGLVKPVPGCPETRTVLRIVDVHALPPIIWDLALPDGRVVSIQVLERMNLSSLE